MRTFRQWIFEEILYPANTLGIARIDMPQVASKDMQELLTFLLSHGVTHHRETVSASKLKPTQKEIDADKARAYTPTGKPILASRDSYVIDGHHQWLNAEMDGRKVEIVRASMDARPLLKLIDSFPKTFHKSI